MNCRGLNVFFRPYTPATINYLEKWLSQKASEGWRLEKKRGWKFAFRKCKPYTTRYFCYSSFGTNNGIASDYWRSKDRYSRTKSAINRIDAAVYEVDINKIDSDFNHFVVLRNKFYLQHYFAMLLFAIVCMAFAVYLTITNPVFAVFLAYGIILLMYSSLSVIILFYEVIKQKTGDGSVS